MVLIKNDQNIELLKEYFLIPSTFVNHKKVVYRQLMLYFRRFVYEHNLNGPAHVIYGNIKYEYKLHEVWMLNGKNNRNNKPSSISCNLVFINIEYHKSGELHNLNGPASIQWRRENKKIEQQYWHHGYLVKQSQIDFDPVEIDYHPHKILDDIKTLFNI